MKMLLSIRVWEEIRYSRGIPERHGTNRQHSGLHVNIKYGTHKRHGSLHVNIKHGMSTHHSSLQYILTSNRVQADITAVYMLT